MWYILVASGKLSTRQFRRCRFNPWIGMIPWRRKWQPTQVFLPGESHGQSSMARLLSTGHKRVRHDSVTNGNSRCRNTGHSPSCAESRCMRRRVRYWRRPVHAQKTALLAKAGACAEDCATDEGRCMRRRVRYWRRPPPHLEKCILW